MPLVSMKQMLLSARDGRYAVPAINVGNYESICAVIEAAEAEQSPVVIQFYKRLVEDGHAERLAPAICRMAQQISAPVALHLDHGDTAALAARCIGYGFTSVMIDGSTLPLEKNVRLVRTGVEVARAACVSVEAELGHVRFGESDSIEAGLTDPSEAAEFAEQTGIDALAVAIGTAHGMYKATPVLDFDRLRRIGAETEIPLVLHGGSDTPPAMLEECVALGITKINIATEYQVLFLRETAHQLQELQDRFLPIDVFMKPVVAKLVEFVRAKMRLFGSSGRAANVSPPHGGSVARRTR